MRLQVSRESCSYLHKPGCQYGASASQPLLGSLGSHSKKKEQAVVGSLGQSGLKPFPCQRILKVVQNDSMRGFSKPKTFFLRDLLDAGMHENTNPVLLV